jgi:hypothetical protein
MASKALLEKGIKGIRYPAGLITGYKVGQAENYVIFDEDLIQIINKDQLRDKK